MILLEKLSHCTKNWLVLMSNQITQGYYRSTFHKDNYRCVYCGKEMLRDLDNWLSLQVDHIKPKKLGGEDDIENRATSCAVCNRYKSSYYPSNYSNLSDEEILNDIRLHVLKKRKEEQIRWMEAMDQYDDFKKLTSPKN